MSTLREHIEAIRDRAYDTYSVKTLTWWENPDDYFRALDLILNDLYDDAVAALAILDFKPLESDLPTDFKDAYDDAFGPLGQ